MDVLEIDAALEPRDQEQRVAGVCSHRGDAAQHRLDVLGRVVALPRQPVGALPLRMRHERMRGGDMIEVVLVHVRIDRRAGAVELEVVLRAGQRREIEELEQIDRQLALDDLDVVQDRLHACRSGKPRM